MLAHASVIRVVPLAPLGTTVLGVQRSSWRASTTAPSASLGASMAFMPLVAGTAPGAARADATNRFALEMSGVRYGLVLLRNAAAAHLVIGTQDLAPPLVALVESFAQGKPVKRDLRLSSGAVVRRASNVRLVSVKRAHAALSTLAES